VCQEATLVARSLIRLRHSLYKLDNGHSVECKLTPTTRSPEICFRTLWPCDLDLWPNIKRVARTHDGLSLWQVWWLYFQPFWFYRADRQTDKQTQTLLPRLSLAWCTKFKAPYAGVTLASRAYFGQNWKKVFKWPKNTKTNTVLKK